MKTKPSLLIPVFLLLISCGGEESTDQADNNQRSVTNDIDVNLTLDTLSPEPDNGELEAEMLDPDCPTYNLRTYLDDPDEAGTNIRNAPGGEVIMTAVKSTDDFEYFITVTTAKEGWFKIKSPIEGMENDLDIPGGEGWIHGSVISVDTRNYGKETIELLSEPQEGADVVAKIKEESYGLKLRDMCGSWIQVVYKGKSGWVKADWLCGNPLTNCS